MAPGKLKKLMELKSNYVNKYRRYTIQIYTMRLMVHRVNYFSSLRHLTECIVRSLGLTASSRFKASLVQGVHHAGVAAKLMHMKVKIVDLVSIHCCNLVKHFLSRLVLNFKSQYCIYYINISHLSNFKKQFLNFNCRFFLTWSECTFGNSELTATRTFDSSSARVVHHAGVADLVVGALKNKMKQKKYENTNLFLLSECFSGEKIGLSLCSKS